MNAFRLLGMELSKLKEQKGLLFSLLGVLLIPLVYAAILLSSTWGPYDYLNNLPVAVVNKDQGAQSGDKPINVGEDLVADLKKTNTLGWEFVSDEEAKKGLDSQKYYMVIEIPEDFSQKVTTVLDANPQVPDLKYVQNEGLNFMAAQVTRSATEKIREQLGNKITETYASNLFSKFGDISSGFKSGADGSQKIYDGTSQLSNGTGQLLQSLTDKTADIQKLADGSEKAENGAGQLLSSIKGGTGDINKLAAGSKQIDQGAGQLKEGSGKVLVGL
ncbi:YhgE/Pip domain-containing protein [Peribacillus alkalitolerans]|uniref:YhgE/Pip domain-containing protein n=1 Tax=Peribacillus alkalitolerans TaxID=1550385 RepID=UPI001F084901|nr:YhgE/Pip domain-containing protein [Peribacillus alkalitolerans]